MKTDTLDLRPDANAKFLGSDGRFEVDASAGTVSASDVAAVGGHLRLLIRQTAPASGGNAGGSGHYSFGSFLIQIVDGNGQLRHEALRKPLRLVMHYSAREEALDLVHAIVVLNGSPPLGINLNPDSSGPSLTVTQAGLGSLSSAPTQVDTSARTLTAATMSTLSPASLTASFNTDSPVAAFGRPDPFNVDLNAGSLTAGYPIAVPAGPGGLTPPINIDYSSAGVAEQHNPQAAAGWVGEGWSLGMGSISWGEHNVAAGAGQTNWRDTWLLNDPYGSASEIIPPTSVAATFNEDSGHGVTASPITWHTAPETHDKVVSITPILQGDPAAVSWGSNRIDIFVRGTDNALWHKWWDNYWSRWENLGGYITSSPAVSSWGAGRLDVFAKGADNAIWQKTFNGSWQPWVSVGTAPGGTNSSKVGVVSLRGQPNVIDLFAIGSDHYAYHMNFNGTAWSAWENLGCCAQGGPAASSWGAGRLDLFIHGMDGYVYSKWYQGSWSGWGTLGGPITSDPAAVSWGFNRIDLYGRGSDNSVITKAWNGSSWANWGSLGGGFTSGPTVASWGVNRLDVFGRGWDNGVYHMAWTGSAWVGWDNQGTPNRPCFRVFRTNGIMEEYGCTQDSVQFYLSPVNNNTSGHDFIANWMLDLITDPHGNQIHVTYNTDMAGVFDVRDVVPATVEWDSPGCQNNVDICPSSNSSTWGWAPLMRVNFVAAHAPARLTGNACPVNGNLRCDDPVDLTGSGGLAAPQVQSTWVLNDAQVQVRSSPSAAWNTLRDYQFSFDQAVSSNITDPVTGKTESVAGKLALTQLQEIGDDGTTALPARTFTYEFHNQYYEDDAYTPNPSNNCSPVDPTLCRLWSKSYEGNHWYLRTASNGLGLGQTFYWVNARSNVWLGNAPNRLDPLACNVAGTDTPITSSPCNWADDQAWSHVVLQQRDSSTNAVTSSTYYSYMLSNFIASPCSGCNQGFYWGNQKDGDYADYYNAKFMGFAQAALTTLDGAKQIHHYYATEGWGVYDCSQVSCAKDPLKPWPQGYIPTYCSGAPCTNDPWWDLGNLAHGHAYEDDYYDTNGALLKQVNTQYQKVCPPSGVAGTPSNGYGSWDGQLVSQLDPSNPVASCDLETAQVDEITVDGSSASLRPDRTTAYAYDSSARAIKKTTTSNDGATTGSATTIVSQPSYVWNDTVTPNLSATSARGVYILDRQSFTDTEDGSGNRLGCSYLSYDGMAYTTGQAAGLTRGDSTQVDRYTYCGTPANGFTDRSGPLTTTTLYDSYGNAVAFSDGDANAGNVAHKGCAVNGGSYSRCINYDSTYHALVISESDALNHVQTNNYSGTASFGFGMWPSTATDANNQTTYFAYDALGRLIGEGLPGETPGLATVSWSYAATCASGSQAPCMEIDRVQRLDSSTTVTTRMFYDGLGNLAETRKQAPSGQDVLGFSQYDSRFRQVFQSVTYYVPTGTGYLSPDTTKPGTSYSYDGLDRVLNTTDPLSGKTTNTFTVVCGSISGDGACYEQTLSADPLAHQGGVLVDALGRKQYVQRFTGNTPASYAVYATTKYTYDVSGNLTKILHPDGSSTTTFQYDHAGRKTQQADPDSGVTTYGFDQDGNLTQSVDARGATGTVFAGYDGIDRPMWRNSTNSATGAFATFTYDSTASGNQGIGRLTGETFTGGPSNSLTGSYAHAYDVRGQETSRTLTVGSQAYPVQTSFDDAGSILTQTYPTSEVVTSTYAQGWLTGVSTRQGSTTTTLLSNAAYSQASNQFGGPAGQMTAASLGGGAYQYSASFDALLRATDLKVTDATGSTTFLEQARTFDGAGNVGSASTTLPAGTDNQAFCYDEQNRLTWAGAIGTPSCGTSLVPGTLTAAQYQVSYTYDALGRLTGGSNSRYSYGPPLHAVRSILFLDPKGLMWMPGYSATYDAAGNMTCRDVTGGTATCGGTNTSTNQQFSFDNKGQLAAWQNAPSNPTSSNGFLYDNLGNRVEQLSTQAGTTTTTIYVGNLEQVAATGSSTTTTTYYYANGRRIALAVNGVFSYLASDGLGSAVGALNASGGVTASQLYAPYGGVRYSNGTMPTDYGFTGQHADATTGLDYYNARYYDPLAAVFISADRILPGGGYDILGLSRYAYVEGNPIGRTDPSGNRLELGCEPGCGDANQSVPTPNDFYVAVKAKYTWVRYIPDNGWAYENDPQLTQREKDLEYISHHGGALTNRDYWALAGYGYGIFLQSAFAGGPPPEDPDLRGGSLNVGRSQSSGPKVGESGGRFAGRPFSGTVKDQEYADAGGMCRYCGRAVARWEARFDHAVPISRQGTNTLANCNCSCIACNSQKSNMTTDEYLRYLDEIVVNGGAPDITDPKDER